jgi:flagellar biosynthesis GTPase FlhF
MEAAVRFFGRRADIETHLVLRAEARSTDMQYMVSRFAGFHPSRLLFTGMDEACGMGAAVDTLIRSGIGVSFLGTGTQIPEGLEAADAWKLARAACARSWGSGPSEKANALAARAA